MKPLYTQQEFENAKVNDTLKLICYHCNNLFNKKKKFIQLNLKKHINILTNNHYEGSCKFCSKNCQTQAQLRKQDVNCKNCNSLFKKKLSEIKKYSNHFCSRSCAGTYNNTHKTHGTRRSKFEIYLEEQLILLYPKIQIDFNKKYAINSELDIYIPSLKLAFELNGIFHYEPIYGPEKLAQIQNNDQRKFQACVENNIELVLIDSSTFTYFKPERANKFLNIIINIINSKLAYTNSKNE